jgi:hypothetical protein
VWRAVLAAVANERQSGAGHDRPERQKAEIPSALIGAGVDVMNFQKVVIEHALDQIEKCPANGEGSHERALRPGYVRFRAGAPQ